MVWFWSAPCSSINLFLDSLLVIEIDDEVYPVAEKSIAAAIVVLAVVDIALLVIELRVSDEKERKESDELY